jgi:hypothetical protein
MKKILILLLFFPLIVSGQNSGPRTSIGTIGNFGNLLNKNIYTNAPIGINVVKFISDDIGIFSDIKYGFGHFPEGEKKRPLHSEINYLNIDNFIDIRFSGFTIINLGVALSIVDADVNQLIGLIGIGISNQKYYEQYYDKVISEFYYYDYYSDLNLNLHFGLQFQTIFQSSILIGYDLNPRGLVFGLGHTL